MKKYICIDIGGTAIKYGIIDEKFEIIKKDEMPTKAMEEGGQGIVSKCKCIVQRHLDCGEKIDGICISTAGMVDAKKGEIVYAYEKFIPSYTGTKLKEILTKRFGIECELENDVNCAGLCEANLGAGKGNSPVVCLTIGTGIGGSIIIDGKIFNGYSNSAGEMGYFMLHNGKSFQEMASTSSLIERVAQKKCISTCELDGKKIFDMAKNGDKDCIDAIDSMSKYLATGIGIICCVLNPEVVVLGGGVMAQSSIFEPKIHEELKKQIIPMLYKNTKIAFAKTKNDAGMLGALLNFLQMQDERKGEKNI